MNLTTFAQGERLRMRLATVLDLSGAAGRAAAPVVDLLVRLALAKAFFSPGMFPDIGAADFPAAWPMIIVQVIGPVLMAIGLLGRPVALVEGEGFEPSVPVEDGIFRDRPGTRRTLRITRKSEESADKLRACRVADGIG
jgi:hypothetical protein